LQLFGHKESDGFELFRSLQTGEPLQVSQVAGSFGGFSQSPSFRLYEVDLNSNFPVKIDVYEVGAHQVARNAD